MKNKSGNRRGTNPNSHGNHRKGGKKKTSVSLLPKTMERAEKFGSSLSDGIDRLFAQLSVFSKAKIAIEMLIEGHPQAKEYSESVLVELEDLEIEQVYEEAKIEGTLPEPRSGAWIV